MGIRIAIADASPAFVAATAAFLAALPGYVLVPTAETADLVLLDLKQAPARGLEFLRGFRAMPGMRVVLTAGGLALVGRDGVFPEEIAA